MLPASTYARAASSRYAARCSGGSHRHSSPATSRSCRTVAAVTSPRAASADHPRGLDRRGAAIGPGIAGSPGGPAEQIPGGPAVTPPGGGQAGLEQQRGEQGRVG